VATGGVDTHLEVHVAAALDEHGGLLGTASFATTVSGYAALVEWLASFGAVVLIGVEGTGSYGAGLTRYLQALGIAVVEVDRPNRQRRRRSGKSDTHDAISAARAAFAGDALGEAKTRMLDELLSSLVAQAAPELVERVGVGTDTAGALLVAAGENTSRIRNERSFARLCGAAPLDASSGKQQRHRLSRGGDCQANSALWRIVITRLSYDSATRQYLQRRCAEGKTKTEAIRCLNRYVARELYTYLPHKTLA
jgi:transposase